MGEGEPGVHPNLYCRDRDEHVLSLYLDQEDDFDTDSEASVVMVDKDSPPNLPIPDSEVAESHPPSPSEDYSTYLHLIRRIAKVMD